MTALELLTAARRAGVRLWVGPDGLLHFSGTPSPSLRATLSARKAELTALLAPPATIARVEGSGPYRLSFEQLRMVFLAELAPADTSYNMCVALRVPGSLDVCALQSAFAEVVAAHEMLRCQYVRASSEPMQVITSSPGVFRHVPVSSDAEAVQVLSDDAAVPFDLYHSPLVRLVVATTGTSTHLLLNVHHSVCDGVSVGLLFDELVLRLSGGVPTPNSLRYVDYAAWQRSRWTTPAAELAFWQDALDGAPTVLSLPTDHPRPALRSHEGHSVSVDVSDSVVSALRAVAAESQATMFMALLTAFSVLLHRYSGQDDLLVGTPVAGRTAETRSLIGLFVNTVIIRADLSDAPTFAEALRRVRSFALAAYAHAELPHDLLVDHLVSRRDPSRNPLFQAFFSYESGGTLFPGATGYDLPGNGAKFDLALTATDLPSGGLRLRFDACDLFTPSTSSQMLHHLVRILESCTSPSPIDTIDLQPDTVFGVGPSVPLDFRSLQSMISAHPTDAVAVEYEDELLTYGALVTRAASLAAWLVSQGAGPGTVVAVDIPRSTDLAVALCGVLFAGAAYLPLDDLPPERRAFMLADAHPVAVLTSPLPTSSSSVIAPSAPGDPAYVLYTSGTTGRPKGVVVPQEAIVNRLLWMAAEYNITTADRILQKTPTSFDVSVWELFLPLITGARLVFARPGGHRDPAYLSSLISTAAITLVHFVPSMLQAFLAEPSLVAGAVLRHVISSGEALPAHVVSAFYQRFDIPLHNLYGPTEAAVDVTAWQCTNGETPVPIGTPIWNTTIHVLDPSLRPVPPGVVGEIYLAGPQLATGYLNRPALTATRFVPNPFTPGTRMYRTGDLARWRPDGTLLYLGRTDTQLKLRGHRIEPSEIEHVLTTHPNVSTAAVTLTADRLTAYVTGTPDIPSLRTHCTRHLPPPMVPTSFVVLDTLPLTPNGKLNTRALPPPPALRTPYAAPTTPRESLLQTLFAELLETDPPSTDADFFALGGHSLLAIRLAHRLSDLLGHQVNVSTIFTSPTISTLATAVEAPPNAVLPLRPGTPALFCLPPAAGTPWPYATLLPHLNCPIYALEDPGSLSTMDALITHYLSQILTIQPTGPHYLLGWSFGALLAHAIATHLPNVALLALIDGYPDATPWPLPDPLAALLTSLGHTNLATSPLSALPKPALTTLATTFARNTTLASTHTPPKFAGNAVLFHTAATPPTAWHPYITGTITTHHIDAPHGHLLTPPNAAKIAGALHPLPAQMT